MTTKISAAGDPNRALRRVHTSVLATLAVCAVLVATSRASETSQEFQRVNHPFSYAALALATGSMLTRRRAVVAGARRRATVVLSLASLLCAAGLGILGLVASRTGVPRDAAFLYVLGGAIFAWRRPTLLPSRAQADGP